LLATHDELTGAPTMTLAIDRLTQAVLSHRRAGDKVAVFFIDLDGFKSVNDVHGHAAGDHALRVTVQRLQGAMRAEDTLARIGGDEFLAIQSGIADAAAAMTNARKLIACLSEPMHFAGHLIIVGASIGIAIAPDHGIDADELIRVADGAMYEAKRAGRNRVELASLDAATGPGR
jgi:diguanylate cyclase (GGDEF)-like protein